MLQCQEPLFCDLSRLSHPSRVSGLACICQREMVASSQSWWPLRCSMWVCLACNLQMELNEYSYMFNHIHIIYILYSSTTGCKTYEYAMLCVLQSIYVVTVYISDPIQLATVPDNCSDIADDCSLHRNFRKHLVENFGTMQVERFHVASKLRPILYCNI